MNAHVTFPSDRILLPRGLVGRPSAMAYQYEIGEPVLWDGECWEIIDRQTSMMGRQTYTVFKADDERPVREVAGFALSPIPAA